jgi:hypothetical protein
MINAIDRFSGAGRHVKASAFDHGLRGQLFATANAARDRACNAENVER